MLRKVLTSFALFAFLAGCGDPTIDGSSEESFEQSSQRMASSLTEAQKERFGQSILILAFDQVFENPEDSAESISVKFRQKMHGKTADQIIALAEETQSRGR